MHLLQHWMQWMLGNVNRLQFLLYILMTWCFDLVHFIEESKNGLPITSRVASLFAFAKGVQTGLNIPQKNLAVFPDEPLFPCAGVEQCV